MPDSPPRPRWARAVRGIPERARLDRRPRLELRLEVPPPSRAPRRPHRRDPRARILLLVAAVVRGDVPSEGGGEPSGRGRDGVRESAGVARNHPRWCVAARRGLRRPGHRLDKEVLRPPPSPPPTLL